MQDYSTSKQRRNQRHELCLGRSVQTGPTAADNDRDQLINPCTAKHFRQMKQLSHNLLVPILAATACFMACSSDNDGGGGPRPSGYDIYAAGYQTPAGKSVATVWKNGTELYALTDGTNDAWAYSVYVAGGTVYTAGYEQQDGKTVAKLWENGTLKYTLGDGDTSYAYSVFAAEGSVFAAGSGQSGSALTAKVWKDGEELYAYSVSPATSQAKSVVVSGGDVYAAGTLSSGLTEPLAVVWKNDKAHFTLSDGQSAAGANVLCPSGRTLYTAGHLGGRAVVWRDGGLLYTLTDGSSYAEATSLCLSKNTIYTAGYYTDGFEEEGIVWENGQELFDLSDGSGSGCLPYSIAVAGSDIYTAGTLFGSTRTAVVWQGDEILRKLGSGPGHSEAYSLFLVPRYD